MGLFEGKTTAERNKTIAALVLPLVALVVLLRMFFGGDSRPPAGPRPGPTPRPVVTGPNGVAAGGEDPSLAMPNPVPSIVPVAYGGPEAARNIFAFPPVPVKPVATPAATPEPPTPTPTPPPPLEVRSVSPANVFARTGDFALEVSGDKFTPASRVFLDGQEVQTTFRGPQQLTAQVPAALIAAQGARTVLVRTPDGALYSNTATINVMPAPTPQVSFVGLFGDKRYARDRAVLKPNQSNELQSVQRGDLVAGRFKVVNISERAVEFEDTQLKIKHTVPYTEARATGAPSSTSPRMPPQPPQKTDDDDEP
jgi:hypothetical protein